MSSFGRALGSLRWFLAANHALAVFSRALLYCLLALSASALIAKILLGQIPSWSVVLGVLLPAVLAIPTLRRFTLAHAAAVLDRTLRLEERLSTALQVQGPFAELQRKDAERQLERADLSAVRRVHWPKELYFAAACGVVLAATLLAPNPAESHPVPDLDPRDQAALTRAELAVRGAKDEGLGSVREIKEKILEELRRARENPALTPAAMEEIQKAVDQARRKLLDGGLGDSERRAWEDLQQALDGAGGAIASRIQGKAAEHLFRPSQATAEKIAKAAGQAPRTGASDPAPFALHVDGKEIPEGMTVGAYADKVRRLYEDSGWNRDYAPIVYEFYGGRH